MGQAKLRGTREERVKQGIEKGKIEQQRLAELKTEQQQKYRDELANMPKNEVNRRHKTQLLIAGIAALSAMTNFR